MITNLTVTGKEWLNNVHEYRHAAIAQISVGIGAGLARVAVEDGGKGVQAEDAVASPERDRLGLATMRERVEMLGDRSGSRVARAGAPGLVLSCPSRR